MAPEDYTFNDRADLLQQRVDQVLFSTLDPKSPKLHGQPMPALTTVLYRLCKNDQTQFEEATRLIELFIREALKT